MAAVSTELNLGVLHQNTNQLHKYCTLWKLAAFPYLTVGFVRFQEAGLHSAEAGGSSFPIHSAVELAVSM